MLSLFHTSSLPGQSTPLLKANSLLAVLVTQTCDRIFDLPALLLDELLPSTLLNPTAQQFVHRLRRYNVSEDPKRMGCLDNVDQSSTAC